MAETGFTFTDFDEAMARGDELLLDLAVTKIIAGVETAQNLAGGYLEIVAKRRLRTLDSTIAFTLTSATEGGGIVIASASAGTAQATIAPEVTWALPDEQVTLNLDCVFVTSTGARHTFRRGRLTIWNGCRAAAPE